PRLGPRRRPRAPPPSLCAAPPRRGRGARARRPPARVPLAPRPPCPLPAAAPRAPAAPDLVARGPAGVGATRPVRRALTRVTARPQSTQRSPRCRGRGSAAAEVVVLPGEHVLAHGGESVDDLGVLGKPGLVLDAARDDGEVARAA